MCQEDISIFEIFEIKDGNGFEKTMGYVNGPGHEDFKKQIEAILEDVDSKKRLDTMEKLLSDVNFDNPEKPQEIQKKHFEESEEWDDIDFSDITQPKRASKEYNRNSKVSVKYKDGKIVKDVKFKKIQGDFEKGKCEIL
jgi:hypothetical protein